MQDLQNFFTFSLPKLDSSIGPAAAAAHFKGLSRGEGRGASDGNGNGDGNGMFVILQKARNSMNHCDND